jgi:cyclohexa-1,5-dienecarbonyl-CoA hydratase
MTVATARVDVSIGDAVARVRLQNPPLNVIDLQMMDELLAAMEQIEERTDVVAAVVFGSARAFSAGVDVAAHTPDKVEAMLGKFHSIIRALVASSKVTIAQVEGACLGGGAEVAMVCDLVYTARDAKWAFPEIKLACYPPVACAVLANLVGQKRAADLILTGRQISGDEALSIGLASGAARGEELPAIIEETIQRLRYLSPAALKLAKKAFYAWDAAHFDKGLARAEKIYFEELMKTSDANEGIQAWLQKRTPVWSRK